jgi:hypothetical protein
MAQMLWWPEPAVGDIVWCHSSQPPDKEPGPKPRPVLVVKVFDDHAPHFYGLVAYGTSQTMQLLHRGEFAITQQDSAAYKLAGLSFDTKFSFVQCFELPYRSDYFKPPPNGKHANSPKLGTLHANMMRKAQSAWSAIKP